MPAIGGRLQHARVTGQQIARHDIGPTHIQTRALGDPGTGSSFASMPGSRRPTVPA
jgi:hypothetical protein